MKTGKKKNLWEKMKSFMEPNEELLSGDNSGPRPREDQIIFVIFYIFWFWVFFMIGKWLWLKLT